MADDRRLARLFAHAPLTQIAARRADRRSRARADRRPRRRDGPRARGAAGRLGGPGPARGPRDAEPRGAARVRAARHVCRALRRNRADTQREVVDACLAAARGGDFEALLEVLDPDVVLRADLGPLPTGGSREVRGAAEVASQALGYSRLGLLMQPALINGAAGSSRRATERPSRLGGSRSGTEESSQSTSWPTRRASAGST